MRSASTSSGSFPTRARMCRSCTATAGAARSWATSRRPIATTSYAHNDELLFADKLTKVRGAHALKFGASVARLQKQQNSTTTRTARWCSRRSRLAGRAARLAICWSGRPFQVTQGTRAKDGRFRMWNVDLFAQDSWKIRLEPDARYGVRVGYWTNNAELNGLGHMVRSRASYDPRTGAFLDPGRHAVERRAVRRAGPGAARPAPEPRAVRAAARQHGLGHQRRRHQRAARRVRDVREPADGECRLRTTRWGSRRTPTTSSADAFYDHETRRAGPDIRHRASHPVPT